MIGYEATWGTLLGFVEERALRSLEVPATGRREPELM
jgi:hypothetical protein